METFDPANVVLVLGGNLIDGAADGTFINLTWDEDGFTGYTGAGGEDARTRSRNGTATLEITVMQTSRSNDVLSAMYNRDLNFGIAPGACQLSEVNGSTVVGTDAAYIAKMPDVGYAKEFGTRTWTIKMPHAKGFVGGVNPTVTGA